MPNLDREPHNSTNGPRDRLPPFYHYPRTSASRQRPRARRGVKTTNRERTAP
uniref:Uncharacterized protein n=1 Tax=Siphoviridae sp. ctj912 TaxID=2827920 RepID=A0A8S5SNH3_9CAUD|nr:MAG TPA: hypothetical protein [Siphoviridae sp. ctj912]